LNKPVDELAGLLGLDIPATPLIDLADIRADGAIIHWSLPDKQKHKSSLKFEIHLNGTVIQTISLQESAVTITGLLPGSSYVVRVGLVSNSDFGSKSAPIRFQTKPPTSGDYFVSAISEPGDGDQDVVPHPIPRAVPYRGLKDITIASPDEQTASRELGAGIGARRATIGIRKVSPALNIPERQDGGPAEEEQGETIQQLTERLDEIRREIEEAERSANDDEEDEVRQKEELLEERDRLKTEMLERDKASKSLRKELSVLERQNTTAQNERIKQDKVLQQKKLERQKLVDDTVQWEREAQEMQQDVERLKQEKLDYVARHKEQREILVRKQATELASIKALEEQLKTKTLEVKKLEREMKEANPNGDAELYLMQQQQDVEERRQWDLHYGALQHEYAVAAQKNEQAKHMHEEQIRILQGLRARRRQEDLAQYSSPPATQQVLPRRTDSQRSRRGQSGQSGPSVTESPRTTLYQSTSSSFGPSLTSTASIFGPPGSIMPFGNGMGSGLSNAEVMLSDVDRQRLTGGALLSPGAGAELLPADLFVDGDSRGSYSMQPLPGLGAIPTTIPGLGEIPAHITPDQATAGPVSPISETGRSQSVFASPQASQQNLHLGSPENIIDADRRSIRSTRSNRATSGGTTGSRFSGMFGIMSRSKAVSSEEGLALGKVQSHSMPRHDQGVPGLDLSSRKRNSSISASVMSGSSLANEAFDDEAVPRTRRPFAFFHKEKGWPSTFAHPRNEPTARPSSMHSIDQPRPSLDGGNRWLVDPWPSNDGNGSGIRSSPLAFGTTSWNPASSQQGRVYGSRLPSRRPSAQYGVHGPAPVGIPEADDFSDVSDADPDAYLAPIGTRPTQSVRKTSNPIEASSSSASAGPTSAPASSSAAVEVDTTKLNPAAKDFKSFFSSIKLRDKDKDKSNKESSSIVGTPTLDGIDTDDSPPASRKSRENRDGNLSLTTTLDSTALESGRQSPLFFALTPSHTNTSEAIAPSPLLSPSVGGSIGKESFMQKLSRKSSSGKFSLPTFKRSGGGGDKSSTSNGSALLTPTTPTTASLFSGGGPSSTSAPTDDDNDDAMSASVGSLRERDSRELKESKSSGRGWGHVLKLGSSSGGAGSSAAGSLGGKRRGGQTPSLSSMSLRSGGTGATEERDGDEE
jgi:hypothetical protein